jgi:hypothetical protein
MVAGCDGSPSSPSGVELFAAGRVNMTFTPQDQTFAEAAEAYRRLWADEGSTIIEAMERGSGLNFLETHVKAVSSKDQAARALAICRCTCEPAIQPM